MGSPVMEEYLKKINQSALRVEDEYICLVGNVDEHIINAL